MGKLLLFTRLSLLRLLVVVAFLSLVAFTYAEDEDRIHETGRCSIRGQCGKEGFFGKELPCPDNGLAKTPGNSTRKRLVSICGEKWNKGDVCCDDDQVRPLNDDHKHCVNRFSIDRSTGKQS